MKDPICYTFQVVVELINSLPVARDGQINSLRTDCCKKGAVRRLEWQELILFHDKSEAGRHIMKSIGAHNSATSKFMSWRTLIFVIS